MVLSPSEFFVFPVFIFQIINFALSLATLAVVIFKYRDKGGE